GIARAGLTAAARGSGRGWGARSSAAASARSAGGGAAAGRAQRRTTCAAPPPGTSDLVEAGAAQSSRAAATPKGSGAAAAYAVCCSGRSRHRVGRMRSVTDYAKPLREEDVDPNPLRQFAIWFREAGTSGIRLPEAAALATASGHGVPSARMVLIKDFDERGFVFYSHYASRKAREVAANPRATLLFHWDPLGRQVRIEGTVERVSAGE